MAEIEYLMPPLIKEILEQQRIILEIHKQLVKQLIHPLLIYKGEIKEGNK